MHIGMTDTGITIITSTEQKDILQFNQNSDVKKAELCVNFQIFGIKLLFYEDIRGHKNNKNNENEE